MFGVPVALDFALSYFFFIGFCPASPTSNIPPIYASSSEPSSSLILSTGSTMEPSTSSILSTGATMEPSTSSILSTGATMEPSTSPIFSTATIVAMPTTPGMSPTSDKDNNLRNILIGVGSAVFIVIVAIIVIVCLLHYRQNSSCTGMETTAPDNIAFSPSKGNRPSIKQLVEAMRMEDIDITQWHDLGLELGISNNILRVIEANNRDVNTCCRIMFEKWLEMTPNASWNQLIIALRAIEMNTAANAISDRPSIKQLAKVMRMEDINMSTRWRDLGLELAVSNNILQVTEANNRNDVNTCCRVMFENWLEMTPNASWNQLIIALKAIEMNTAANAISKLFNSDDNDSSTAINEILPKLLDRGGQELMDAIKKSRSIITEKINFATLIPYLNKYSIFTRREMTIFNSPALIQGDKASSLIEWLGKKEDEGVKNFIRALNDASEHSGHANILQCIHEWPSSTT